MDRKLFLIIGLVVLITACSNTIKETTIQNNTKESSEKSLREMFDMKRNLTYSVDWQLTTIKDGQTAETTFKQYYSGDKFRLDMTKEGVTGHLYYSNNTMHTCFVDQNYIWICKKLNYETSIYENIETDIVENDAEYVVEKTASRKILDQDTACYLVVSEESVEYCFNEKGMLFFIEAEQNNTITRFEAIDFSTTLSEEALKLPIGI